MIAPTPISALVHSSTLVTRGIIIFMKFNRIFISRKTFIFLIWFSLGSLIYARSKSILEKDFKKIIAFSTLRQVSLLLLLGGLNLKVLIFFHLLTHATIKFVLFLVFGELINQKFGSQEIRNGVSFLPYNKKILGGVSILGLLGLFFLSSSVSKEMILISL